MLSRVSIFIVMPKLPNMGCMCCQGLSCVACERFFWFGFNFQILSHPMFIAFIRSLQLTKFSLPTLLINCLSHWSTWVCFKLPLGYYTVAPRYEYYCIFEQQNYFTNERSQCVKNRLLLRKCAVRIFILLFATLTHSFCNE